MLRIKVLEAYAFQSYVMIKADVNGIPLGPIAFDAPVTREKIEEEVKKYYEKYAKADELLKSAERFVGTEWTYIRKDRAPID